MGVDTNDGRRSSGGAKERDVIGLTDSVGEYARSHCSGCLWTPILRKFSNSLGVITTCQYCVIVHACVRRCIEYAISGVSLRSTCLNMGQFLTKLMKLIASRFASIAFPHLPALRFANLGDKV